MTKTPVSYVERWPMMSPGEFILTLVTYLLFVLKIGPLIMDKYEPFQLKRLLVFYNMFKIVNSAFLGYEFCNYIIHNGIFQRRCEQNESDLYFIGVMYWKYMMTKVLDLVDTVFFVLRKKQEQISFLHVYHHSFMVFISWMSLKYDPSDHWAFMAMTNCGIHTLMYVYYLLSAMGPEYCKYLWWKKYLTMMQLVQFVLIIIHLMIQTQTSPCPMRPSTYWLGLTNLVFFIYLFSDFYNKRYKTIKDNTKKHPDQFICNHIE